MVSRPWWRARDAAKIVPLVRRVDRRGIGSLAGQVDLSGDRDSPETNDRFADDFGIPT
ncbi:prevent-host-death protein [Cryptosporangium sp. NPDC048952]|uniref:prevent-host-death protein n=1 Tax=Cryptosporangium sp. NPDC048952 TaxID=3363961 RepID=UPI00371EFA8F